MSAGVEKRIQALYCDLILDDQSRAPAFNTLLGPRASSRATFARNFAQVLVGLAVTASIVAALFLTIAIWPRRTEVVRMNVPPTHPLTPEERRNWAAITLPKPHHPKRAATRRTRAKAVVKISENVASISSWQSPTELFMQSTSDAVLKSMPELDQSLKALQSFLPKEHLKEHNQ